MASEDVSSELQAEKKADDFVEVDVTKEVDLVDYYEEAAGRLVVDPEQAKLQFGEVIASRLKLSADGSKILWPQPTNDPNDPQNWTDFRKNMHLLIMTMSAIVPDFDSGIGIASIFGLAQTYDTSTGAINNLTSNWSIFLNGWGGLFWVILMRRYGRLPVLFWSQPAICICVLDRRHICTQSSYICRNALPDRVLWVCHHVIRKFVKLNTVAELALKLRYGYDNLRDGSNIHQPLKGLYIVADIFPFHLQARKLNIWTSGFIISPFLSPFAFGFLVARTSWRWAYGIGSMYSAIVLLLIAFFMDETMYDRHLTSIPSRTSTGLRYRFETLIGVTGYKMAKYRARWSEVLWASLDVAWRPQFFFVVLFEAFVFGFSIGVNIAVFIGEFTGRYMNDFIMNLNIRRNGGFFEVESRLWTCYVAMPLYICGFLTLGAGIEHLNTAALIMGWGIAFVAITLNTVAVYAYCNDSFPRRAGEVSALLNFARSMGGFAVAYFQVPWATKSGGLVVFGTEAAQVISILTLDHPNGLYRLVIAMFLIAVPMTQLKGGYFRARFAL
ncbi:hypothetical protein AZE42_11554 [Rhizopogon vesiculosus]|uniref:Major facilitator superfamily (MFS) profile domain-containing protein n=1 Tax=Rhizopogon vesiculosus TaxID=180088 RepID=A0A1J8PQT9_9AGAM|nr:hypothetical protein AZE42_11554 [Rhizopogon vesiculosus]